MMYNDHTTTNPHRRQMEYHDFGDDIYFSPNDILRLQEVLTSFKTMSAGVSPELTRSAVLKRVNTLQGCCYAICQSSGYHIFLFKPDANIVTAPVTRLRPLSIRPVSQIIHYILVAFIDNFSFFVIVFGFFGYNRRLFSHDLILGLQIKKKNSLT
jgi:hypothetical protein